MTKSIILRASFQQRDQSLIDMNLGAVRLKAAF